MRTIKMITVTTADGSILDFGDLIEEPTQIAVGSKATFNSSPATGEFVLTDGRTLTFVDGAITKIKEPSLVEALMISMKKATTELRSWKSLMMPGEAKHNNHRKLWKS